MRELIISIIVAVIFISTAFVQSGKITVDISDIEKIEGQLAMGLYNKSDSFPEISKACKGIYFKVTKKNIQYIFSEIPIGDYAVAVFHDVNSNNKLDKNFLGIPKEGYAFSKNAKGNFGPPLSIKQNLNLLLLTLLKLQ